MQQTIKKLVSYILLSMLFFSMIAPVLPSGAAQAATTKWVTFKYDDFTDPYVTSVLSLNGKSVLVNDTSVSPKKFLRLNSATDGYNGYWNTPSRSGSYGTTFSKQKIYNQKNFSFSTYFSFRFTGQGFAPGFNNLTYNPSGLSGADGMTFTVQTMQNNAGTPGGGMGYYGIAPSFAVKFDTYKNPDLGDPSDSYIGLAKDGSMNNTLGSYDLLSPLNYKLKDGSVYYAWIDYDGLAKNVKVYINKADNKSTATKAIDASNIDLGTIFANQSAVYAGFTASTGGAWENHDILKWYFTNDLDPIDTSDPTVTYKQAPSTVTLASAPNEKPGKTQVWANVLDTSGNGVANVPVTFKTDSGTIEDLNGTAISPAVVYTDALGQARVLLNMGSTPILSPGSITAVAAGGAYKSMPLTPSPTNLTKISVTSTSATLSWSPVTGAASYKVFDDGTPLPAQVGTNYMVSGLTPGTSHKYIVTAVDPSGIQSAPTAPVNVVTPVPVPTLPATPSPGTGPGTTKVTATAEGSNRLVTKVSSSIIPTPNVGDPAPTGAGVTDPYTSGADISGADAITNKYIGIYEVDSSNKVVSFKLIILTAGDIKSPAPTLPATPSPGTSPGTTKVTATAGGSNHLVTKVSSSIIPTPYAGDPAPTGAGVTDPYTSGADISGADAITNKYIGIYEVDSSNKVVSFKLIILTAGDITNPAPTLPATPSPGTGPGTTKVTATAGGSNHLVTKVSSSIIPTPNVGDPAPTGAGVTDPYTPGTDIAGADAITNKYIGIYEVDSNNKVVSFKLIILTAGDITNPVPTLPATPSPGTGPGTTKVTATAEGSNRLVTKVSSSIIPTPNAGDPVPTGAGVTDPYTSGADISGADATTNKYIGIYEVDSSNKVVSFKLIVLTAGDITNPAPTLPATPSPGTGPGTTKVTATAGGSNHLVTKVSSSIIPTPNVGDPAPTGAGVTDPYTPGTDIAGADAITNKYIGVYEVDSNNKVVSFKLIILTAGDIMNPAPTLPATPSPGTGPGTTKVTATAGGSNHLVTKVSSGIIPTPNVGDPAPTGAGVTDPYAPGTDISGVDTTSNKYIGVYEVDSNNKVVSFKLITLTAGDISNPAPTLPATPSPGTGPGTTKVTATAGGSNHLVTKISSGIIPTPNVGDPAPTGAGVTDPYAPGTDISGVDTASNKYIGVYEVDSNNKVVSFKLITLTAGDIAAAAQTIVDLLAYPSNGLLQVGATQALVTKAVYSDQSVFDVTNKAAYSTSDPTVATVDPRGVVTAKSGGTTVITAVYGGKSVTAVFQVQGGTPDISLNLTASPDSVVGDGKSLITLKASVVSSVYGNPVAGKTIMFRGIDNSTRTAVTDSTGTATVTFTAPAIDGVIPVHNTVTASAVDSKGLLAQKSISVHYMPASVHGVLIDKVTGKPIAGAIVSVSTDFNGDGIVDFSQEVTTGADGSYQIYVPRGNWNYTMNIQTPVKIGNQTVMLNRTQTAQVGGLNGTGQTFTSVNKISGQLLISNSAANNSNTQPTIGSLFGTGNVSAVVQGTGGNNFKSQVTLDANGNFDVNNVPQGQYTIAYQIKAPNGALLAGPKVTVNVDQNGEMSVVYSLIDPYGVVTDAATGQPVEGVIMNLYWADTALNRQNGRTPGTLVNLPELTNFAPNQNHNPQVTNAAGEYAWMVFPDGDYYIVASKPGYGTFSTLDAQTNVPAENGSDSYIRNGIIHVGQNIVQFSFSMQQLPSEPSSGSSGTVSGGASINAPTGLTTSNVTPTGTTLSWNAVTGASSYNIYDNGKLIVSGIAGTSYEMTGLEAGTKHTLTVSAVVNGVESAPSASQTITTAAKPANPAAPQALQHHKKYIEGYPDGTFKPERNVTREEVAAMLFRVYGLSKSGNDGTTYSDVSNANWGAEEIAAVTKAGMMNGYPDGTFRPNQPITREEMAGIAARLKHLKSKGLDAFTDISDSWARESINAAAGDGILKGFEDGTFRPKANTTRAEVVTMFNRLMGRGPLTGTDAPTWSDVSPNYWAFGDIEEASTDHDFIVQDRSERRIGTEKTE